MKNIAICIPFYKSMDTHAVASLISMLAGIHARGDRYTMVHCQSMYINEARSFLTKTVVEQIPDADYILFIDTDHIYSADALYSLIATMEKENLELLSAAYVRRGRHKQLVHMRATAPGEEPTPIPAGSVAGLTDADVIGLGFCVLRPKALRDLWDRYGLGLFTSGYESGKVHVGDDVRFSERAHESGKRVVFDAGVKVGHIAQMVL